jgi:hypothetical protein
MGAWQASAATNTNFTSDRGTIDCDFTVEAGPLRPAGPNGPDEPSFLQPFFASDALDGTRPRMPDGWPSIRLRLPRRTIAKMHAGIDCDGGNLEGIRMIPQHFSPAGYKAGREQEPPRHLCAPPSINLMPAWAFPLAIMNNSPIGWMTR